MRRGLLAVGAAGAVGALLHLARVNARLPTDRVLDADEVRCLYDSVAGSYDLANSFYRLVGARRLARRGIAELGLRPGDTVVDLGCGTGVNLPELAAAVAPGGRVIGVDLSEEMLARARRRVDREDVIIDLVAGDVREVALPPADGVVSTFALEMVPEHDVVMERAVAALRDGGRIAVLGLQDPPGWPEPLVKLAIWLNAPFGTTSAYRDIHPRESLRQHATEVLHETAMSGAIYLSVGQPDPTP